MNLVPYETEKVKWYRRSKNQQILEEFIDSDLKCAKLEGWPQISAKSCQSSMLTTLKRLHISTVKVLKRGDIIILLKVEA